MVAESYPTKRFTADEVLQMVEAGLLQDERVELIEGELIVVPPQGATHSSLTVGIHELLKERYGRDFHVRDHSTVRATRDSLPEPDIHDRRKANVYAAAGYAHYWLVDVDARRVEVRTALIDGEYAKTDIVDVHATLALPGSTPTVAVRELLP